MSAQWFAQNSIHPSQCSHSGGKSTYFLSIFLIIRYGYTATVCEHWNRVYLPTVGGEKFLRSLYSLKTWCCKPVFIRTRTKKDHKIESSDFVARRCTSFYWMRKVGKIRVSQQHKATEKNFNHVLCSLTQSDTNIGLEFLVSAHQKQCVWRFFSQLLLHNASIIENIDVLFIYLLKRILNWLFLRDFFLYTLNECCRYETLERKHFC